ncbi:unnamed protein product [Caenorhabditis auriculariae]|uniref:Uncharacterized protein n=1 Tax=Caenorhabditis auriculariae TaxID=2777116 RepID=A0A8S1HBS2_9PELO|nr:unnamed protein product [Caenorhabditis auriculariae]
MWNDGYVAVSIFLGTVSIIITIFVILFNFRLCHIISDTRNSQTLSNTRKILSRGRSAVSNGMVRLGSSKM